MPSPPTHYAHSGDASIAYQVFGRGSFDLVLVEGPASHLELMWEEPRTAKCFERLGSFARVIMFDRRGTGLSDPVSQPPTLEQQMDDLIAVLDDIGVERAAIWGASDLGLSAMFAATYPERVISLVLSSVSPRGASTLSPELHEQFLDAIERHWGEGTLVNIYAPSQAHNKQFVEWWARMQRSAVSPGMARQLMQMLAETDLTAVLPTISVPTLVTHASDDRYIPVETGREVASLIPGARFIEYPGQDSYAWLEAPGLDDVEEFLTGQRPTGLIDRVLATVMFTDIVGSTERASQIGDRRWRELLAEHHAAVRAQLARYRGSEVKTIGDGFLATFDGPARAVRCAAQIADEVEELGLEIRAGLHTGECELVGADVAGIAVHIGARVMATAEAGEVLASRTVKDLVVGSGLRFEDRGLYALRGGPDDWRLYALDRSSSAWPSNPVRDSQAEGSSSSASVGSASGLENT
ncbi:MAG TPA: alpha/beta fold hydrolase [Solirubrobacteraceae bacterium]|jgi:class 3 adenylate cyclase